MSLYSGFEYISQKVVAHSVLNGLLRARTFRSASHCSKQSRFRHTLLWFPDNMLKFSAKILVKLQRMNMCISTTATQDLNIREANSHTKIKIRNLGMKYSINFDLEWRSPTKSCRRKSIGNLFLQLGVSLSHVMPRFKFHSYELQLSLLLISYYQLTKPNQKSCIPINWSRLNKFLAILLCQGLYM